MGGKSKPTIGYWYRYLMHFGISQVLDALLEVRGGEKTAWAGRAEGGTIAIDARELWGGEKAEGGIEGDLDVMLGHADQVPSTRLASLLGDQQSAFQGKATVAFEGLYGAFNPYPKAPSFKGVRIFQGWQDDTVWYPDKASVPMGYDTALPAAWFEGGFSAHPFGQFVDAGTAYPGPNEWTAQMAEYYGLSYTPIGQPLFFWRDNESGLVYSKRQEGVSTNPPMVAELIDRGWQPNQTAVIQYYDTSYLAVSLFTLGASSDPPPAPEGYAWDEQGDSPMSTSLGTVRLWGASLIAPEATESTLEGMNAAHMLYDALTHSSMQGEPIDAINDPSFRASADLFYFEGFGLCTKYNPVTESVEGYIKRVCNVVGANLVRSRVDGKYYLYPVRGVHDLDVLPILEDDDILEYEEEPSDPLESVNQVSVEWFDPVAKKKRTTTPVQSLGSIQSIGGIIAEVASYPEIPVERLALQVAARDLAQKSTPLKRFRLTTNRVPYAWRAGEYFRLQAPRRGIADMVCMVGEIDAGTPRSGSMRLVAIQDVSRMPATVYVQPEPGVDTSPSQVPTVPDAQQLIEAPYVELAGDLPAGELSALADDAGFLLAMASRPTSGLNYTLFTAADGESLADRGSGDWCPTALVVEAATRDPGQVAFTLSDGLDLSLVEVGTAALWGSEICRVDTIDVDAMTVTLGRGCADTTPGLHAPAERIWFYDTWSASDRREYAGGETVSAKLRTRTSSQLLNATLAPTLNLELDERAVRPYPPGALTVTDLVESEAVDPDVCFGELTLGWAHRDRLMQADQLVDGAAGDVGPEAGTTYTVRYYLDEVLVETETGITGTFATPYTLPADGLARVEVEAVRDGFTSWQAAVAAFEYHVEPFDVRIADDDDTRITDAGDTRITE